MFRSTSAHASMTRSPIGWMHIVTVAALFVSLLSALSVAAASAEPGNIAANALNVVRPSDIGSGPGQWHTANERSGARSLIAPLPDARGGNGSLRQSLPTSGTPSPKTDMQVFSSDTTYVEGEGFDAPIGFGKVSELTATSFDWYRDVNSTAPAHLSPAMRLWVFDPDRGTNGTSYIAIWEKVYNGGGAAPTNTWVQEDLTGDNLWVIPQYIDGVWKGISYCNSLGSSDPDNCFKFDRSIQEWNFGPNAVVFGVEVGLGSGWAGSYLGRADHISLTANSATTSWDFEPGSTSTEAVYASGEDGWVTWTDSTASVDFVSGPATPPLGVGSVRMQPGTDGDSAGRLRTTNLDGTLLSDLTSLSYQTYVSTNVDCQAPYMLIEVDLDGNTTADDYLFFEPCYQLGNSGDVFPSQGTVALNTWQMWDTLTGGWWADSDGTGGPPVHTLATFIAAHPTATVATSALGGVRLQVGRGGAAWANNVSYVDTVTLGTPTATTTYNFDPFVDASAPTTSDVIATAYRPVAPGTIVLAATVSDVNSGGSAISSAVYTLNGGSPIPIYALDRTFDEAEEQVRAILTRVPAGTYTLCVRGTDANGNIGEEACTTVTINAQVPPPPSPPVDNEAPIVSNLQSELNPVRNNQQTLITAVVDDSTTGGSKIASAQYQINGGSWSSMSASDGTWNTPTETVKKALSFANGGTYEICVRGKDAANRTSASVCMTQIVFEREDGSVTASGQFTSPKQAIAPTPTHTGRATFSLSAAYAAGKWTPDGVFNLTFTGSPVRFQSSALEWLVIDGNAGSVQGVGALNGRSGYTFQVSFRDNGSGSNDRIRIRIWHTSSGEVVYDSQPGKSATAAPTIRLTSGNIAIQQ